MKKKQEKIIIAMSGGVDSSVAAKLLSKNNDAAGIFLHFWKDETGANQGDQEAVENKCCSTKAMLDAGKISRQIGIPLYTMNFGEIFKKEIVDNFIDEYGKGCTPNPCVRCNKLVKLGLLIKRVQKLGFDYVASGHYARISRKGSEIKLLKAKDKNKDQSYFLYALTREQLAHLQFPLGNYTKDQVRQMAKRFNLSVATKKDSQEVCFIPEKSHNEFLKRHLKLKKGPIVILEQTEESRDNQQRSEDSLLAQSGHVMTGKIVGEHQGLPLYTIGQRKGVEIGGTGPFYVAKCDYKTNTLYVVKDGNDPLLFSDSLVARDINWISGQEPKLPLKCEAVIRYRHKPVKCIVTKASLDKKPACRQAGRPYRTGRGKGDLCLVAFSEPQRAITPGQSVVFYKGDEVLGGGIIALA